MDKMLESVGAQPTPDELTDKPDNAASIKENGFVVARRCTDGLCCIIFIAHFVLFLIVTVMGMADGNPAKLYSPRDYAGHYCGVETNWNDGPDLSSQTKLAYMMNVSKSVDVVMKQLVCSTAAQNYLIPAVGDNKLVTTVNGTTTADGTDDYLCACCIKPCSTCTGSLALGGDLSTSADAGNVISSRMVELTGLSESVGNLFDPAGANGDYFTTIWDEASSFFVKVCLPNCDTNYESNQPRTYVYRPDDDDKLLSAWMALWQDGAPAAIKTVINDNFKFSALSESDCPYTASRCVPMPGVKFSEISVGYCSFEMGAEVINAVGQAAASTMQSTGLDSFVESASETFGLWVGDFEKSIDSFIIVAVLSFVIGLVFLVILRFTVGLCVWFAVWLMLAILIFGGLCSFVRANQCSGAGMFDTGKEMVVAVAASGAAAGENLITGESSNEACTGNCADYRGSQTHTRTGKTCQAWGTSLPHALAATYTSAGNSSNYPEADLVRNFCRNPYNAGNSNPASSIWCFTTDTETTWELCTPIGVISTPCEHGYQVTGEDARLALEIIAYIIWSLGGIWLLIVLCCVSRIKMAIALNQVAADFVAATPRVVILPIVQTIVYIVWVLLWCLSASFLLSQVPDGYAPTGTFSTYAEAYGTEDDPGACTDKWPTGFVWKEDTNCDLANGLPQCWKCAPPRYAIDYRVFYSFFTFLWVNAFQVAIGQCLIAGAVGVWFFTPNDKKGKLGGSAALLTSAKNTFRYHLGSLAFGSFIIALVQFIRAVMFYFEKQAEAQKNKVCQTILWALQCVVACFERCIKFLNKNAYIQVAIRGTGFCTSAKKAFQIILANFLRFGIVAVLGNVIHVIGYLFIMSATVIVGYFILTAMHSDISLVVPLIVYAALSYVVGALYMNVFGLAVDTCLQCFLFAEEERLAEGCVPASLQKLLSNSKGQTIEPSTEAI